MGAGVVMVPTQKVGGRRDAERDVAVVKLYSQGLAASWELREYKLLFE